MIGNTLGQGYTTERYAKVHLVAETSVDVPVPINANRHNVAIETVGGGAAGDAAVSVRPVGLTSYIALLESDGTTPVVLDMITGDARADIRGSYDSIRFASSAFDGTEYKIVVASYID